MSSGRKGRFSAAREDASILAAAALGVLLIAMAAFRAVPGVFSVDGLTYQAMIDAFVRNGSLFVENGYDDHPSPALTLPIIWLADAMIEKGTAGGAEPAFGIDHGKEFYRKAPPGDAGAGAGAGDSDGDGEQ